MIKLDKKLKLPETDNSVLTVGELLIDMISSEYDDNYKCNSYNRFFGGSPANIAMNLRKLGIKSIVASAVGKDGLGNYLLNEIEEAGLDTQYIQQVEHSTSMVLITKSKTNPVPIFYRGADSNLDYTPELERAVKNSKIVHFSCWAVSKLPIRHTMEEVIREAKKNKCLIGFDPNYHRDIWQKEEDGVKYVKSIIERVDIIKPSEVDAERLFGKDSHENQIDKFLQLGAKLVIMTLGEDGAIVSNGDERVYLKSMADKVVDTTGAGDAFWSGFYAALVEGSTVREALSYGFAVSAYKLRYLGAVVDLPLIDKVKELYNL